MASPASSPPSSAIGPGARSMTRNNFPVIMRAKNEVREIPRSYLDHKVSKHQTRAKWVHAGHTLLHDLKENVVTPYVMVESLGWFYGIPIFGKTLLPLLYRRWTAWLRRLFVPVDRDDAHRRQAGASRNGGDARRRAAGRRAEGAARAAGLRSSHITPTLVEALRQRALCGSGEPDPPLLQAATRRPGSRRTR